MRTPGSIMKALSGVGGWLESGSEGSHRRYHDAHLSLAASEGNHNGPADVLQPQITA